MSGQLVTEEDDGVGHFQPAGNVFNMGPPEDDGVGHFLPAGNVFNMGPPEDIHRRLTWAYVCKKLSSRF
jgi:hypothetical protein